jgi:MFS-type transporter involved in bile tolerance (Atg22 family)
MFGHARTAVKFFVYGLLIGIFFAPRSGAESRTAAIEWATDAVKSVMGGSK